MTKRKIILFGFIVLVMLMGAFVSVSAQNVDNMSNEELTTLLLQIMQKLEQSEELPETPEPTPTPTPAPTNTPQPEPGDDRAELESLLMAIMQKLQQGENTGTAPQKPAGTMVPVNDEPENEIWENKKLIIEGLPSYMFIQPTQPVLPEPVTTPDTNNNDNNRGREDDSHGFITDDDVDYCPPPFFWVCYPDRCVCASPNG